MSAADPHLPVVFLAFSNDSENPLPAVVAEYHQLVERLEQPAVRRISRLVTAPFVTPADIISTFQNPVYAGRIAVFHFAGHTDDLYMLLHNWQGHSTKVSAGGLAVFLGCQPGLHLVFINGCANATQVQALLDAGVAVVIATSELIADHAAAAFATHFYSFLATGDYIELAFNRACAAMQLHGHDANDFSEPPSTASSAEPLPWRCYVRPGAELALRWNLPDAAGDPLFGLPDLAEHYFQNLPDSPFRGLTWFPTDHAALFFGRGYQIRELYELITNPFASFLLFLYGQSGAGKSSLLAAGLAPRLASTHSMVYLRRDQQLGLLGTLRSVFYSCSEDQSLYELWSAAELHSQRPLVVVLDQVEELFTRPNPNQPHELLDLLIALKPAVLPTGSRLQGKLVLGFRKEWLAELKRNAADIQLPYIEMFLQRLDRRGIIEAVTGPAQTTGIQAKYHLDVASDLPSRIADDLLDDPGSAIAPMLQIVLTMLWERARRRSYASPAFDTKLYQQLLREQPQSPDVAADEKRAPNLYGVLNQLMGELQLRQPDAVASGLASDLLAFHTTIVGTAEQHTQSEVHDAYSHRAAIIPGLLMACRDLYLLIDPAENQPEAESASRLAHDTLAPWVRLRYDESDQPGQRARRILESRSGSWSTGHSGATLDEPDLLLVEQGQEGMRCWTPAEARLVEASRAARERRRRQALRLSRLKRAAFAFMALVLSLVVLQQGWNLYARIYLQTSKWQPLAGENFPDDATVYTVAFANDRTSPTGHLYCVGTWTVGVGCSQDGITWNFYQQGLPTSDCLPMSVGPWCGNGRGITALTFDVSNPRRLYLFSRDSHVYRSGNGGQSWLASTALPTDTEVTSLAAQGQVVVAVASRFHQASEQRLYISDDGAQHFTKVIEPDDPQIGRAFDAAILPSGDTILVASSTGLWQGRRSSGGWRWQPDGAQTDPFSSCAVAPSAERRLLEQAPANPQLLAVVAYDPGTQHSTLQLETRGSIQCVAEWSGEPRQLTIDPRLTALSPPGVPIGYVLLKDGSVVKIDAHGHALHIDGLAHFVFGNPYDLKVVPQPKGQGVWLLLGHRRGVMKYIDDRDVNF